MAQKFCTRCGAQLKEGLRFCPQCGNPVKNPGGPNDGVSANPASSPDVGKDARRILDIANAVMILLFWIVGLVSVLIADYVWPRTSLYAALEKGLMVEDIVLSLVDISLTFVAIAAYLALVITKKSPIARVVANGLSIALALPITITSVLGYFSESYDEYGGGRTFAGFIFIGIIVFGIIGLVVSIYILKASIRAKRANK